MREKIIELLDDNLVRSPENIEECTDLVDGGYLDSIDIVSLVLDLNDTFDVSITASELEPENFNSVDAIIKLIEELS